MGAAEWVKTDGGNDNRVAGVAIRPMAATEKWLTQRFSKESEVWIIMDTYGVTARAWTVGEACPVELFVSIQRPAGIA